MKENIQAYSRRSPIRFSVGVAIFFVVFNVLTGAVFHLLPDSTVAEIIYELLYIAWPAALTIYCGYGFVYRQKGFFACLGAGLPAYLLFGVAFIETLSATAANPNLEWKPALECFLGALMLVGVGFREETLFRGIVLNAISRKYATGTRGLWISVLSAGAIFGGLHAANVINGVNLGSALIQSITAFSTGVFYCAVYLRGGSIWALSLLHTLTNAAGTVEVLFANGGNVGTVINSIDLSNLLFVPVGFLMAAFLLRKSKRQKVLARLEKIRSETAV